ncbi:hypothetical protein [Cytobacillus gottheilii]|uniref:hypothetical protein n=1 Tax=Cytobacillus gottheilii TaxID=859144 RepID=UPI000830123B|nr:hypothetical protein [Cytobacillus gottheilii]
MISFILAAISLIVIIPLVIYLPLGLTKKGKVMMTVLSFSFALLGIAGQSVMELWKLLLILLLLVVMSGYLMMKRSEQFLAAEATADTAFPLYNQDDHQEYKEKEAEEEVSPIEDHDSVIEMIETDHDEENVLEVFEAEIIVPVADSKQTDAVVLAEKAEAESETEAEAVDGQLDEIDFDQIRLTELAQDKETLAIDEKEDESKDAELSYIGELESLMSDDNPVIQVEQKYEENLPGKTEENEFSLGLELEDDDFIIPASVENETSTSEQELKSEESELLDESSYIIPSLEEMLEEDEVSAEEILQPQDGEELIVLEEFQESLEEEVVNESDEIIPELMADEEDPIIEEEEEPWILAATSSDSDEEQQEQEENITLQREVLKTLLEQLQLAKETTEPHVYEKWIQQCMQQKMPQKEHYIFASLLIEHYISQQEHQKLKTLLNELKKQYSNMPIISEQIQFLLLSYSNQEQ